MANVLICDDEADIVSALRIYLSAEGYRILEASNGREALELVKREEVHLVLLDIMMPEMDGITALSKIRAIKNVPIILLTAKSEDTDKILGLTVGADDYITKPFNSAEVIARVKSQLRRYLHLGGGMVQKDVLRCGGIELDAKRQQVTVDGKEVSLTPTEYEILKLLMSHPGEVFSPETIYTRVWHDDPYGSQGTVPVHVRHLREKIEINPADPRYLKVVWGRGYKMERSLTDDAAALREERRE